MLLRVAPTSPKIAFFTAFAALSLANCVLIAEVDFSKIPKGDTGGQGGQAGQGGGSAACLIDSDCNDDSGCTTDRCVSSACTHAPVAEGTDCGSTKCVTNAACSVSGECITTPVTIDDSNACTTDACDPTSGSITHTPANVDDMVACTTDECDPTTGTITHTPANAGCLSWQALPTMGAPTPREHHTAVWTGTKMIIWGGSGELAAEAALNNGAIYDPATRTWSPTSMVNAPSPRHSHQAVWTGSKMIVWGGFGQTVIATGGGIYDPTTDSWTAMTTTGDPAPRIRHTAVWNGSKMLMWGGLVNNVPVGQGAAFDPATNTWTNIPSAGQPPARFDHSAVWTDNRMIIWGGQNYADWLNIGSIYNPTTNTWIGQTPEQDAPETRELHSGVWTGTSMLIWGGWQGGKYINTGGILDLATSTWKAMTTTGAPSPRSEQAGVWTGKNFVVWGGCGENYCNTVYGDGGIYTPNASGGTWEPIPVHPAVAARRRHAFVWTGSKLIVWGGKDSNGMLNTGGEASLPL